MSSIQLDKLEEAEYFYDQMRSCEGDTRVFRFNLSAYLSAARATLFMVIREARSRSRVLKDKTPSAWADGLEGSRPFAKPLIDYRDVNLKERLAPLHGQITTSAQAVIQSTASSSRALVRDGHEEPVPLEETNPEQPSAVPPSRTPGSARTVFPEWPYPEDDLFGACRRILTELQCIIDEGHRRNHLNPP